MAIGTPATSLIAEGIKQYDASRYTKIDNNHYYTWHRVDSDLSPAVRSTEFDAVANNLLSSINSIYGSLSQGKEIDYESRMAVDIIGSTLLNKDLADFSRNRKSYIPMLTGSPDLEDKSVLQAWSDNFNSYWLSKKIAKKMNLFDVTEDEEEKSRILEDLDLLNRELVKLGDYKSRNDVVNGFIQSGRITAQGVEQLAYSLGTALTFGALSGATIAASAGDSLLSGITKAYLLNNKAKAARITGTALGAITNTFAVERGSLSYELYNMTDEDGRRMSDDTRRIASTIGALLSTSIEYVTPGPDMFIDKFIKGKVGKQVVRNSISKALVEYAKLEAIGALGESIEEGLQTGSNIIVGDIAKYISDKKGNTKYNVDFWNTFENTLYESTKSMAESILPSIFAGGAGNLVQTLRTVKIDSLSAKDKNAIKNAKKNQDFAETDLNVTIINSDNISGTGLKPTKDYTVSTDTEGKETKVKLDTIKVVRDPESLTDFIPATDEEADKVQFLKSKGQSHIAVEVIDDDSAFTEMSSESLGNLVAMNNGTIENNNPTFSTKEDFDAFKESMNKLHVMTNEKGEYLVTDGNGNNMAINPVLTSQQDAQIIRETEKEVGKPFVEQVRQAYKDAGANVSDREIALASKLAGMLGNANKVAVLSENDSSVTEEERKALAGSRGITHFTSDTARSIRIILSKDADATTVVHEMFHVALRTNKEARTRLISSFKQTLANDKTRAELKKFYEDHMEILQDNDLKTAEDVLTVLDLLEEDNVFTDSIFEEVLTKTFEAFDADNNIRADKRMPIALKKFFEELSTLFKSIYKSITGKDLAKLPSKVESSYKSFLNTKESGNPNQIKSATDNTGEFSSDNPSILHQDILDTTLLDEGATRKHWSDVSEDDAVAFVNSDVLIPDSVLQKYSERFEIRQEIELRKNLLTIANLTQKMSAARAMSIGEFFDSLKEEYGEAFEQTHMKELFRKFYIYANTQTPKQMEQSFVNEYSTVQKLIELKNIISPRMVARRQNGKVVRSLFVPQTGYAYNSLKNITENSSAEEIKEALNKIKKNPSVFLKAMLRSKADYQKFRALNNDSDAYVKTVGQIYYLSTSKADLAFLENLRKISNDSLDSEDRDIAEQIKEFNKEKIEFGKNSIDETFVEAEGKFMQDELDAMSELMKTNVHNARIEERDRAYKKEQKVKGDYQNKLDKANEKVKSVREAERDAKREAVELERLKGQIKAYDIKQSYGKKIEDLKMMKNLEIEQLRYIKNKKIENISEEWKRKNKEVIEKYKKWKDNAVKNVEKEYDIRINNLKLKIKEKELKEKTDRQIKRKLSFDSSRHDAFAIRSIKYVHSLIYNLAEGMDADEVASYSTRTGKDGEEDLIVTYYQEDADGNEIESQTAMNIGLDNIYHGDIPNELVSYLSDNVISKLNRPDFRWYMLSSSERKNILEALVSVKKDAETSLNYKKAHKQYRRSEMWSKAAASILKRDELLTDKDIDALSKELGIPKDDPDFMRKARKKFVEEIDKFEKAPTLTWKNKVAGVIASTFGHIGPIARFLDGGKEGAIYDLFVNRPQKALDAFASAVQKRNEEARLAFDEILNSGELSRENKFAELAKKVEIETNNINGEKQELTGWNIMGAYIYAQNVHGFVKLIAPNGGNNISLEQMARINPKATLEIINEALLEMREHKEQEVRRYEYNQKRGTEYKPNEYSGLLKRYDEIVLENLRDRIESNMIQPMLPDWAMALGDSMIDLLSKYTNDVGKAAYDLYNMPFTKQKRYFPLVGYANSKDASLAELMTAQRTVSHGFIQERTKKENYALLLDPMAIFFSAIEAQERMIHLTEVVKDMDYALQSYGGNLKKIVADRFGTDMAGYLDSQLRTLAGEHYHLSRYEKIANAFLQKASLSKLGFNVVSTGKQFISAIPAIADGEISVVDFIGAIALNNSNKQAVIDTYNRLAPDIAQSSVEYDIRQMKKANQTTKAGTKIAKLEETAMKLTETADQYIKRIVWTASFEKHMKAGLSEEDSALKASALVKRTQSISGAYDLSEIQRSKNPWVRAFFMFTNDLFQTWNTLTLGIASDIKSKDYLRAFEKAIGFALTSSALALAAFGWLPEEDEEEGLFDSDSFFKDLAKSLVSGTPLVGTALEDAVSGFKSTLIGLPEELVSIATMPIHHEERGYTWADYADQLYDTLLEALSLTGAPTVSIDRTLKMTAFPGGFAEGPNFSLDNLAYGLGSRAGESLPNFLREIADELN